MRVPFSRLKEYVDLPETAEEVGRLLAAAGLPVAGVEQEGPEVRGIVTGLVLEVAPHPDADRLRVTRVRIGPEETLQVVTAAPNVREGQVVALATHGARLADGSRIKKGKLRGLASEGMFCSSNELGMDGSHLPIEQQEGILDLPEGVEPGQDACRVLGLREEVLVLEAAERPDLSTLDGVARTVAEVLGRPLRTPPSPAASEG